VAAAAELYGALGRSYPMAHLSHSVSGALRTFSYWLANKSVGHPLLEGVDYSCIFEEPSALETVYAIFANVLEFDEAGQVINAKHAERRAAQYILQYVTGQETQPPFESWEVALHEPPPGEDPEKSSSTA
jgi:hypothetical protein